MATFRKRGDKWQVQVRRQGSPPITKSFTLKADAEMWARQMEAQVDRQGLPPDPRGAQKTTLKELIVRYRNEVVPTKRGKAIETVILNAVLRQSFVKRSLADASPAVFGAYRDERLKKVKPATVCRELGILQHMFDVAMREWGMPIPANPLRAVKKPKLGPSRNRRVDGEAELANLIEASAQCRNPYVGPLFLFALETGMRRGELVNIRWGQIDRAKRTLHIPVTKNGHPRTIPLSTAALGILATLPRENDEAPKPDERVFPLSTNAVKLAWRRLRQRAGADGLRFHDLRHEAVSAFFEKGLSVPEVALISGHRDPRMLFRYTHLKAEDVAAKLG